MGTFSLRRIIISLLICSLVLSPTFSSEFKLSANKYSEILKSSLFAQVSNTEELDSETQASVAAWLVEFIIPSYLRQIIHDHTSDLTAAGEILPRFEELLLSRNVSETCAAHFTQLLETIVISLRNPAYIFNDTAAWAIQMVDSWSKFPEGVLSGHVNGYGDWDECVNIQSHSSISEPFVGEYCITFLVPSGPNLEENEPTQTTANLGRKAVTPIEWLDELVNPLLFPLSPSFASCIPSTCSLEDHQIILDVLFFFSENIKPLAVYCETSEKPDLDTGAISMIVVLSLLSATIIIATVVDTWFDYQKSLTHLKSRIGIRILLAFSLTANVAKWANTSSAEGGFGCIHGMRFLSTCWVVLGHTIFIIPYQLPMWNIIEANNILERHWSIYFLLNGFFSVDTFFTMSGLLAAYSIMKALEKGIGRLNPFRLYFHRFLRLTPTYGFIVGMLANLYKYIGSGPVIQLMSADSGKQCRKFWWHNLLYINNLWEYDVEKGEAMCEGESWYIANDMQFFILCPLFMILIYRWRGIGLGVLAAASLGSILAPGLYAGINELPPTRILWKSYDPKTYTLYIKPWFRIGPYLVGMWMGYFLFKLGKKPVRLPKLFVVGAWMLSTSVALALILGIIPYYDPQNEDSVVGAAFYAGLSRFTWGIVICWIIFACSKGYGGWVNSFLSWKAFVPLGRLTFCVYLSSVSIQFVLQLGLKHPMVFDMYHIVNMFFSHLVMSFLVGFVFSMAFESPFIALEKIIFGYAGSQSQPAGKNAGITGQNYPENTDVNHSLSAENYSRPINEKSS